MNKKTTIFLICLCGILVTLWILLQSEKRSANIYVGSKGKVDSIVSLKQLDTIQGNGYKLFLSPMDSVKFTKYFDNYSDQIMKSQIKDTGGNHLVYADFMRKILIANKDFVIRKDSALILKIGEHDSMVLVDGKKDTLEPLSGIGYSFLDFNRKSGYYIVEGEGYEYGFYLLINQRTGRKTETTGRPYFSPDGTKVLALIGGDGSMFTRSVSVYKCDNNAIKEIVKIEPSNYSPEQGFWLDNKTFAFSRTEYFKNVIKYNFTKAVIEKY